MIKDFFKFIGGMLSDEGEPSSKRGAGFIILIFLLLVYAFRGLPYEDMVTFLSAALLALGMSGLEKLKTK